MSAAQQTAMMRLYCVNVGYGDAFLFCGPEGVCLLDTGSGLPAEYAGAGRTPIRSFLKRHGIRRIDHLIYTHIHEDHVGGLPACLGEVEIGRVWMPFDPDELDDLISVTELPVFQKHRGELFMCSLQAFSDAFRWFRAHAVPIHRLRAGDHTRFAGLKIDVLGARTEYLDRYMTLFRELAASGADEDRFTELAEHMDVMGNSTSLLLNIRYGSLEGLFCADNIPANWEMSDELISVLKNVTVFKVPHHAQADGMNDAVAALMPLKYCITTASSDHRYNSAHHSVYDRLNRQAAADGRTVRCLFTDPAPDSGQWKGPGAQTAVVFEMRAEPGAPYHCYLEGTDATREAGGDAALTRISIA